MEILLDVRNLRAFFDTDAGVARAVDGVSFSIRRGECLALVGESGCGKSVTSLTVMRLLPSPPARIAGGEVIFKDRNLLELSEDEMCAVRGREIAMIFQEPQSALNPVFAVGEQIAEAYLAHNPGTRRKEAFERAVDAMRQVGIPDAPRRAHDFPHQLSGGMKQRVCIAMALICGPELLIADEPTTALDVTIQAQILELLKKLQTERHLSLLLITHDLGIVAEMAERTCVMYAGKIVEQCPTADILKRPLHPYTQGLLRARPGAVFPSPSGRGAGGEGAALPSPSGRGVGGEGNRRLSVIPGLVPAATQFTDNCRFNPRCPLRTQECIDREPPLLEYGGGHFAACWHTKAEGIEAWKEPVGSGR